MPTYKIPISIIPLDDKGIHLLVKINIFKKEFTAVLDTGASRTVIHRNILEEFSNSISNNSNLQANTIFSTTDTVVAEIPKFKIGTFSIKNYQAVGIDLNPVTETYALLGHPPIAAIIGGDILNDYQAIINYAKAELKLKK